MTTESATEAQIAEYISRMCRELAAMAKRANMTLPFNLLMLTAIQAEQQALQPQTRTKKAASAGSR